MNRRQFVSGITVLFPLLTAGCVGTGDTSGNCDEAPTVSADEPTLAPGEQTVISIAVANVTELWIEIGGTPTAESLGIDIGDPEPSPNAIAGSHPPKWSWSACTEVEVPLSVRADDGAQTGEYAYTVGMSQSTGTPGSAVKQDFTIHISESNP